MNISGLWEFQRLDIGSRRQGTYGGTFRKLGPTLDNSAAVQCVEDFLHKGSVLFFNKQLKENECLYGTGK